MPQIEAQAVSKDVIIVPVRSLESLRESYSRWPDWELRLETEFLPLMRRYVPPLLMQGAHLIEIDKNPDTEAQIQGLLDHLGMEWTPEIREFIDEWEPVNNGDERSEEVLRMIGRVLNRSSKENALQ